MLVAVVVWRATSTKKKLCGSPTPVLMEKLTDLTPINQNIVKNTINDFIPKHKNWRATDTLLSYIGESQKALEIFHDFTFLGLDKLLFAMNIASLHTVIHDEGLLAVKHFFLSTYC